MIEMKVYNEVRDGNNGFTVSGQIEGKPSTIIEELAYGCKDIIDQLGDSNLRMMQFLLTLKMITLGK